MKKKMWRVLIRVVSILDDSLIVVVPGWASNFKLKIMLQDVPSILRSELKVGLRFFAKANIGTDPEPGAYLRFDFTEMEIPPDDLPISVKLEHCSPGYSADCVNCPITEIVDGLEYRCDCDCHFTGINRDSPPFHINHAELTRTDESAFRSQCPSCNRGTLLMRRDPESFELLAEDYCILCGQPIIYDDIETMKAREKGEECQPTESSSKK